MRFGTPFGTCPMFEVIQFYLLLISALGVDKRTQSYRTEDSIRGAETRPPLATESRQPPTLQLSARQQFEPTAGEAALQAPAAFARSVSMSAILGTQVAQLRTILVSTCCILLLVLGLTALLFSVRVPRQRSAGVSPWVAYVPRRATNEHVLLADMSPRIDGKVAAPLQPKPSNPYAKFPSSNLERISSMSSSPKSYGAGESGCIGNLSSRSLIERLDEILGKRWKPDERLFGNVIDKVADPSYDSIDLTVDPHLRRE